MKSENNILSGAQGRNRTSDTRIFNPSPNSQLQRLKAIHTVKAGDFVNNLAWLCQTYRQALVEIALPAPLPVSLTVGGE